MSDFAPIPHPQLPECFLFFAHFNFEYFFFTSLPLHCSLLVKRDLSTFTMHLINTSLIQALSNQCVHLFMHACKCVCEGERKREQTNASVVGFVLKWCWCLMNIISGQMGIKEQWGDEIWNIEREGAIEPEQLLGRAWRCPANCGE